MLTLAVVLISVCLYFPDSRMGFVLDDHYVIAQNPVLKNPELYPQIFSSGFFAAAHQKSESGLNYYRPFLTASFIGDYRLFGLWPPGFRWINIFFHILNCLLMYELLRYVVKREETAALAALLFCILPAHEWVVRYITGRGDLLQAFFSLISLIWLRQSLKEDNHLKYLGSQMAFVFSLLCREVSVINVGLGFCLIYFKERDFKEAIKVTAPYAMIAAAYFLFRMPSLPVTSHGIEPQGWKTILFIFTNFSHLFVPAVLRAVMPGFLTFLVFGVAAGFLLYQLSFRKPEERPVVLFAAAWLVICLSPLIVTENMATRLGPVLSEHFLYFPGVGFALLVALAIERIETPIRQKMILVGILVGCLAIGFFNGRFWKSEEQLLRYTQLLERKNFTVVNEQLLMKYSEDEQGVLAMIARSSSYDKKSLWLRKLGSIYRNRGEYQQAIEALQEALTNNPYNVEALNLLGVVYWETNRIEEGFTCLKKSLSIDPHQPEASRLLAITYARLGFKQPAIQMLQFSLKNDPDNPESRKLYDEFLNLPVWTQSQP